MICVLKDFPDGWNAWSKGKRSFNGPSPICVSMPKQGSLHAKNRGVFMPKQGSFHSFGNVQNESLSQFAWSCEILAWLCETDKGSAKIFSPLDHFAWLCEIHLKDCSKMSHLDHFAHSCEIFAWLCKTDVDDCNNFMPLDHFASACEFSHDYAKILLKATIR